MKPYPWQLELWQRITHARKTNRLPHAMLVSGAAGLGKRYLAEAFASYLLCSSPLSDDSACGQCKGCLLFKAGSHPDLYRIEPEEPGKNILIASIRAFIEKAGLTNQLGGYKVVIIEPAEAMNIAAANSLLKTLEEPVPSTLLILVSSNPSRLQPTIRSRCQNFLLAPPDYQQATDWLASQGITERAKLLLGLTSGAPLNAVKLNDEQILKTRMDSLKDFVNLLEGRGDPLATAERWEKQNLDQLFYWMSGWLIDMLRLLAGEPVKITNPDQRKRFIGLIRNLNSRNLFGMLDKVYQARQALNQQLNTQLLLEDLMLSIIQCSNLSTR